MHRVGWRFDDLGEEWEIHGDAGDARQIANGGVVVVGIQPVDIGVVSMVEAEQRRLQVHHTHEIGL